MLFGQKHRAANSRSSPASLRLYRKKLCAGRFRGKLFTEALPLLCALLSPSKAKSQKVQKLAQRLELPGRKLRAQIAAAGILPPTASRHHGPLLKAPSRIQSEKLSSEEAPRADGVLCQLSPKSATWLLNAVALGYASTAVLVKVMESSTASPAADGTSLHFALRFVAAALFLLPISLFRHQASLRRRRREGQRSVELGAEEDRAMLGKSGELGLWMFLTYAGQAIGLQTSSADHASLLLTVGVVLVPFLEALSGHAIGRSVWVATILASTGTVLLEGGGGAFDGGDWGVHMPAGDLWCLAGAACSAIHVVRSESLSRRFEPLALVATQLSVAALLSLPWLAWDVWRAPAGALALGPLLVSAPWAMILLAGPLGTAVAEWLELEALRHVKASTATLILAASPIWGGVLAYLLLGETMEGSAAAGALLILTASLEVQLMAPHDQEGAAAAAEGVDTSGGAVPDSARSKGVIAAARPLPDPRPPSKAARRYMSRDGNGAHGQRVGLGRWRADSLSSAAHASRQVQSSARRWHLDAISRWCRRLMAQEQDLLSNGGCGQHRQKGR